MLGIVREPEVQTEGVSNAIHKGRDRAIPLCFDNVIFPVIFHNGCNLFTFVRAFQRSGGEGHQREGRIRLLYELGPECRPDRVSVDFLAGSIGYLLDCLTELGLRRFRQLDRMIGFEQ